MLEYGLELLAERVKKRLTQGEIAAPAGINVGTLVDIERQRIGLDTESYQRLLGVIREAQPIEDAAVQPEQTSEAA